jgi:PIN domain nuclease of toxin-antitoxin system
MKTAVLDSSAMIALLMEQPGEEHVRARLSNAVMSSVNLAEVLSWFARRGGTREAVMAIIAALPVELVVFDVELATIAGMLVAATREAGLSLGDCACLALASSRKADAITADRAWRKIGSDIGIEIVIIR